MTGLFGALTGSASQQRMNNMRYKIIFTSLSYKDDTLRAHQRKVQNHIDNGWKLQGEVSIAKAKNGVISMAQAMVKEE